MRFASAVAALALLLPLGLASADETAAPLAKKPMLYVAVGPDATLLLQGTLHIPDTRITTVTPIEKAALDRADELWAEVDFSNDIPGQMLPFVRLPRNRNLDMLLGDELKARVVAMLKRFDKRYPPWRSLKPWLLDSALGLLFAPKETATELNLDEVLFAEMKKRGKPAGGLETVYEQIRVVDQLDYKEQVALLEGTLTRLESDVKSGRNSVETMIKIFLSGDDAELLTEVESYFDFNSKRDRDLYERMHGKRNERMLERLAEKAKAKPGLMRYVAVGAAHLPGKRGMLRILGRSGYVVWRVEAPEDVPVSREASLAKALVELKRQNAGLSQSLRSLEEQVLRLRDRMDKRESKDAARDRRARASSSSDGKGCRPKRRRRRCCIPCPPVPRRCR